MTQLNMQISDFNLDYLSSDEKNRFYKIFQILNDIWDRTQEQIISTCKNPTCLQSFRRFTLVATTQLNTQLELSNTATN